MIYDKNKGFVMDLNTNDTCLLSNTVNEENLMVDWVEESNDMIFFDFIS